MRLVGPTPSGTGLVPRCMGLSIHAGARCAVLGPATEQKGEHMMIEVLTANTAMVTFCAGMLVGYLIALVSVAVTAYIGRLTS